MTFPTVISTGALALFGTALLAFPGAGIAANASAAQSTTKACSQQYQTAKTAGTLNGKKWPQFLSDCSAAMKTDTSAGASSTMAAPAAADMTTSKKSTKQAAAATTTGHQTTQQICSAQYQAAKTAGTLNGQKWSDFLSSCSASIKSDKEDASAVPPEPPATASTTTTTATTKSAAVTTKSADGKQLTPGQVAFRQRIHECSVEWQSEKSAGTLPTGSKWPQFWSSCNTRLKAQG